MAKMLWKPSKERIKGSNMYRFMQFINERHGTDFQEYMPLYRWSVEHIPEFWAALW
ncbi:MAG: acetoacetyl-CoA synthetase, partial [Thermodesulfobacteriota bacterium]|nr:acetoacetyl-CoA synthetase [Thermodesulfobacteriota bacterium]